MILNNSLSLMDENYFNFQLEMADLQTYHSVYSSALEITNESENVFVKIKNAIVNFFKKIINFIRNIFKKETKETVNKNLLSNPCFLFLSPSLIINLEKIRGVNKNGIIEFEDETSYPVSKTQIEKILKRFNE